MPRRVGLLLVATCLAGCTNLPVGGPQHWDIEGHATSSLTVERRNVAQRYVLVDLTNEVVQQVPVVGPGSFYGGFGERGRTVTAQRFGVGDLLQVTIFESSSGGLFSPGDGSLRPGNFVALPTQTVSPRGTITIPYAGDVQASGRTVQEVQKEIERKLAGRAVEPQVLITIGEQVASSVTVIGESTGKLQLRGNERVLDMIARSGGIRAPAHELFVTLIRQGRRETVYFPTLVRAPRENIYVAPGDTINVYREPQKFVAVGAFGAGGVTSGVTGLFNFDEERLSLHEAVAKAGGLVDGRASARVFVYRLEHRKALQGMGVDVSRFADAELIPTIYRANYRDPSVFFITQQFPMRHRDAIYVSNADAVELEKFMAHTLAITGTVAGVTGDLAATRENLRVLGR